MCCPSFAWLNFFENNRPSSAHLMKFKPPGKLIFMCNGKLGRQQFSHGKTMVGCSFHLWRGEWAKHLAEFASLCSDTWSLHSKRCRFQKKNNWNHFWFKKQQWIKKLQRYYLFLLLLLGNGTMPNAKGFILFFSPKWLNSN